MRLVRSVLFALFAAWPCGCMEMPISTVEKSGGGPVVVRDAGDDTSIDPQQACFVCMEAAEDPGPGCQNHFAACDANLPCQSIIQCGRDNHCFQGSKRGFLGCGLPCLSAGDVRTPDDMTLILASNLFQCIANGPCGPSCFQSE